MILFLFVLASCLVILLLTLGVLIRAYFAVITIENFSMSPTLEHGDRVLVVRRWPSKWLHKGQIVLVWPRCTSSIRPTLFEVKPYIKRIVGLGGETLTISLNDRAETATLHQRNAGNHHCQQVWHIPQGHIFVRGDNRTSSLDSLSWGPIPLDSILGVVLLKLPRQAPSSHFVSQNFVNNNGLPLGQAAPPFTAQALHGETVTLDTYSGQAVIFLFFAPANHCREIISLCTALAPEVADAGITMVLVSSAGIQATRTFTDELGISLPVLVAPRASNPFLQDYAVSGIPAYCFVNAQGKVQFAEYANMRWGGWKTLVESMVGHAVSVEDDEYVSG